MATFLFITDLYMYIYTHTYKGLYTTYLYTDTFLKCRSWADFRWVESNIRYNMRISYMIHAFKRITLIEKRRMNNSKSIQLKITWELLSLSSFSQLSDLYQINLELLINQLSTAIRYTLCNLQVDREKLRI